jgi:hypothetical protein
MFDGSVTEPRSMAMQDQVNAAPELKSKRCPAVTFLKMS